MIENATFLVTNRCNSRCSNCNIWKYPKKNDELTIDEIKILFSLNELKYLKELGISGGEPFLLDDIVDVLKTILTTNKTIEKLYITTNASRPEKVIETCDFLKDSNLKIYIGVSIDGTQEVNKKIRGVDSYKNAVSLLKCLKRNYPEFQLSISFTVNEFNCNKVNMEHIKWLANDIGCDFTFRVAESSTAYYKNEIVNNNLTNEQFEFLIDFIVKNKLNDKFMNEALYYYLTKKVPIMYDYSSNQIKCGAGKDFVFIHPNGDIYPCLYAEKDMQIGDKHGFYQDYYKKKIITKKCPCMTECTVWPTIIKLEKLRKDNEL